MKPTSSGTNSRSMISNQANHPHPSVAGLLRVVGIGGDKACLQGMYLSKYIEIYELDPCWSLLVNSLTGAVELIDEESKKILESIRLGKGQTLEASFFQRLKERGHLFENAEQEEELALRLLHQFHPVKAQAHKFVICPTYSCNLSCIYCFESPVLRAQNRVMSENQVETIFETIPKLNGESKVSEISLFGGEPLLNRTYPSVARIFSMASDRGYPLSITTNGVNLKKFEKLLSKYSDLITQIQITLDGTEEVHNKRRLYASGRPTFSQIVEGIDSLISLDIRTRIRVNVDSANLHHLPAFASFIKEKGWLKNGKIKVSVTQVNDHINPSRLPHFLREDEMIRRISNLIEYERDVSEVFDIRTFRILSHLAGVLGIDSNSPSLPAFYYCEASRNEFYVFGPDGCIYPCNELIGQEDLAIGTFYPEFEICDKKREMWEDRNVLSVSKCRNCSIAFFCGGGCAYAALVLNGSTRKPSCSSAKEIVRDYIDGVKEELLAKF